MKSALRNGDAKDVPKFAESAAEETLKSLKAKPSLAGITVAYASGKVSGSQFSGETKTFVVPKNGLHVLYMISSGPDIWHGTYTGPAKYWPEAENIIKGIRYAD